ncbi:MAG: hypothetical protein ACO1N0_18315 [Fluviicola sp.]
MITTTKEDVKKFLKDFRERKGIWGILFRDDRGKNTQALADLEMRPVDRAKVIDSLEEIDFVETIEDKLNKGGLMWVFGKMVKKKELYIKITMGMAGTSVICISFHLAEHVLHYPFKP